MLQFLALVEHWKMISSEVKFDFRKKKNSKRELQWDVVKTATTSSRFPFLFCSDSEGNKSKLLFKFV